MKSNIVIPLSCGKGILLDDMAEYKDTAYYRNSVYRGKNLGSSLSSDQANAISTGKFDDMFIGDYWSINNIVWRIAHFDYYYLCGDTSSTTHHVLVVPDTHLYTGAMNSTNTTAGGYYGSAMRTSGLDNAKTTAKNAFGEDHILVHREYLTNAVTNGRPSAGAWYDSDVELMNENMCYGSHIFAPTSDGSSVPTNYTIDRGQLALFMYRPDKIHTRGYRCWLRDVVSSTSFADVSSYGNAHCSDASYVGGVRPVIPIC